MKTSVVFLILVTSLATSGSTEIAPTEPDEVTIEEMSHWFGPVEFSHADHQESAADCTACHHDEEPDDIGLCSGCHGVDYDPEDPETPDLKMAFHLLCIGCHQQEDAPRECVDCHERKALPPGPELLEARLPE